MKIGFSWAYSVGKTTLADFTSERFNLPKLSEPVRSMDKKPSELSEEHLHLMQWMFAKMMMRQHVDNDDYVSDATIADTLAYSQTMPEYDTVLRQSKNAVRWMYDIVFYVPIEFPVTDDWFRHLDEKYREEINMKILDLHKELWITPIEIRWTLEERKEAIINHVEAWMKSSAQR